MIGYIAIKEVRKIAKNVNCEPFLKHCDLIESYVNKAESAIGDKYKRNYCICEYGYQLSRSIHQSYTNCIVEMYKDCCYLYLQGYLEKINLLLRKLHDSTRDNFTQKRIKQLRFHIQKTRSLFTKKK